MILFYSLTGKSVKAQESENFTDPRDGQIYKTVNIDNQIWLAENMDFKTKENSWCYNDDSSYCKIYGRLYTWNTAKEACPKNWHVPSEDDWQKLIDFLGGEKIAGQKLKATKGWKTTETKGANSSNFSALPGGARNYGAVCVRAGTHGYYWSGTELYGGAWYYELSYDNYKINKYASNYKGPGFSVRCIMDK